MKLLVLGLNYAPEPVGIGPYTSQMAQSLAGLGHDVKVVAGVPYYPQWQRDRSLPAGWSRREEDGVTVLRCPHYIPADPTGVRRIVHHASFALAAFPRMLATAWQQRPDFVFCIAPSLLSLPVAWVAARVTGAKLWLHVQDFEVEAAFATGLIGNEGAIARTLRCLEIRLLRSADVASSISPQMVRKLAEKGMPAARLYELRNWADEGVSQDPTRGARYREAWGIGDRKVALYSGNIANKQGIEILIDVARVLRDRHDLVFVICGNGPNRARLEQLAAGLDNIVFQDLQPRDRISEFLGMADVHLLPQIADAADLVLPSKLTNMLASGRPVVATARPGTGLHDEVEGCGLSVPPGDPAAMAKAICALVDDPALAQSCGAAASERARERWARWSIIGRLDQALRQWLR